MKRILIALAGATVFAGSAIAQQPAPSGASATARMGDAGRQGSRDGHFQPDEIGHAARDRRDDRLARRPHGFHIHEKGQCDGDFEPPAVTTRGRDGAWHRRRGRTACWRFPNVHVGQDGVLKVEFFTDRLSLADGAETPLIDEDGSSVMLHADPDDYASDPAGHAGHRLACGVIQQRPDIHTNSEDISGASGRQMPEGHRPTLKIDLTLEGNDQVRSSATGFQAHASNSGSWPPGGGLIAITSSSPSNRKANHRCFWPRYRPLERDPTFSGGRS